jgi:8-oxo-dGTP pyrophosphatase MutT (NUDIX family)
VTAPPLLSALLDAVVPADEREQADLRTLRAHAASLADPFSRDQPVAHFTGSALVTDGTRVALVLHRKLGRWLQPGGHADSADGGDLVRTALREAEEETGLRVHLHPSAPRPLDVDVHQIPARPESPGHLHLDVRFLVLADPGGALTADPGESAEVGWFALEEALRLADDPSLRRLLGKARPYLDAPGG